MSYTLFDKSNLSTTEDTLVEMRIWNHFEPVRWGLVPKEVQNELIARGLVEKASAHSGYRLSNSGFDYANSIIASRWVNHELQRRANL